MDNQELVLITGANGGVGFALCSAFTASGFKVIATDSQTKPVLKLSASSYLELDLAAFVNDIDYAKQRLEQLAQIIDGKGLFCLINNAAIQILKSTENLTRQDFGTSLQINTMAPFFLSQALLKDLEKAKGSILNISSIHAKLTKKNFVAYATTKAALSGMTRALAVDIGNRVRVNAIEPAAVNTPMLKASFLYNPQKLEELKSIHPTGDIAAPNEIAAVAIMLTGRSVPFLNGAIIEVNGGVNCCLKDLD